jgi:hypothetical protein
MEFLKQCVLVNGKLTTVAWITEASAKIGKWVSLDEDKTEWEVRSVSKVRVLKSEALMKAHQSKTAFESIRK